MNLHSAVASGFIQCGGAESSASRESSARIISQDVYKVVLQKSLSQFPHESVNIFFAITDIKNKLTDLCGNRLLQHNFMNTFCEIKAVPRGTARCGCLDFRHEVMGPPKGRVALRQGPGCLRTPVNVGAIGLAFEPLA